MQIPEFQLDQDISFNDQLLGSDAENNLQTKNFKVGNLYSLFLDTLPATATGGTKFLDGTFTTTTGSGIDTDPFQVHVVGLEPTVINSGGHITVAGSGTTLDPYVLTGEEPPELALLYGGDNINVVGSGTAIDPYFIHNTIPLLQSEPNTILGNISGTLGEPTSLNPLQIRTVSSTESTTQLDTRDAANRDRANHIGTQTASTISDLMAAVDGRTGYNNTDWDIASTKSPQSVSFNTLNGLLAITLKDSTTLQKNIDGRYLTNIQEGTGISVDLTDPTRPVLSLAGGGSSNTYSNIYNNSYYNVGSDTLVGEVDGVNTVFTAGEGLYRDGTAIVYYQGQTLYDGAGITETDPSTGTITFDTAPLIGTGSDILFSYEVGTAGSGQAGIGDMLKADNLNGLTNLPSARANLGLGALAILNEVPSANIVDAAITNAKLSSMAANTFKGRIGTNGPVQDLTANQVLTAIGSESVAQLNARDTENRKRANHTGTQLSSTISDLATFVDSRAGYNYLNWDTAFNWGNHNASGYEVQSDKGSANGYVPLNGLAQIDSSFLPDSVYDILEYTDIATFPVTGESKKIYIALDTKFIYRWSGPNYEKIGSAFNGYYLGDVVFDGNFTVRDDIFGGGNIQVGASHNTTGLHSCAIGSSNDATGDYSASFGLNTEATGKASFAAGYETEATGMYSVAFGINSESIGKASASFGWGSEVSANYSFAAGKNNTITATGTYATAFGNNNYVSGLHAIAIGDSNFPSGEGSSSIGGYGQAQGSYSHSNGIGAIARSFGEIAMGTYNTTTSVNSKTLHSVADRLFILGNGATSSSRSDALIVLKSGLITAPSLTTAMIDSGSGSTLVTKEWSEANGFDKTGDTMTGDLTIANPNGDGSLFLSNGSQLRDNATNQTVLSSYAVGGQVILRPLGTNATEGEVIIDEDGTSLNRDLTVNTVTTESNIFLGNGTQLRDNGTNATIISSYATDGRVIIRPLGSTDITAQTYFGENEVTIGTDLEIGAIYTNKTVGSVRIAGNGSNRGITLWNEGGTGTTKRIWVDDAADTLHLTSGSVSANGIEIDSSGLLTANSGINVNGQMQCDRAWIDSSSDGARLLRFNTDRGWEFRQLGTGASTRLGLIDLNGSKAFTIGDFNNDDNIVFTSSGNGNFGGAVTATSHPTTSDIRLKKEIADISKDVSDIKFKSYKFIKGEEDRKRYGVIAQEIEENHPEFVLTDEEGMKSVSYTDLLIAKVAQQDKDIAELKSLVKQLMAK